MSLDEQKNLLDTELQDNDNPFSSFEEVNDTSRKQSKASLFLTSSVGIMATIVTTVVLIAGIVLLVIFDPFNKPDTDANDADDSIVEDTTITLMDKAKENKVVINKVDVKNDGDSYSIVYNKNEELFYIDGYSDVLLSTSMSNQLQEYSATFIATEKVNDASNLKDFGLDKPTATATITFMDKSTATIQVGNATPDEAGYYVKTNKAEGVYIFDANAVYPFISRKTAYVDTTLISTPSVKKDDTDGQAVLKTISYSGKNHPNSLTLRRSYQTDNEEMTMFSYIITEPYKRGTTDDVGGVLGSFVGLSAEQAMIIKPTAAEKKALGFDNPLIVMELTMAVETADEKDEEKTRYYNETHSTITVGSMDNEDYVVMVEGIDIIFLVGKDSFSSIADRTYDNSVSKLLFVKNITEIGRVSITLNGKTYDFNLKHFDTEDKDTSLKVTVGDKTYPTTDFRELYAILMTLERYGSTNQKPTDDMLMSIKMYHTDGSFYMGADYYSLDGNLCYVKTTEGETFTTRWHYVTHFTEQIENYLNGEKVVLLT